MKVGDFKTIVSPKVNVPIERMRLVFGGKQLLDDKPICEYVSESGLTVHLIARTAQPSEQPQPQQQSQPQPQPAQNMPPPPPINPFGDIMGMMNSILLPGQQDSNGPISMSISSNLGNLNGSPFAGLGGLLNGLGIQIPQPPQPQQVPPPQQVPRPQPVQQPQQVPQ